MKSDLVDIEVTVHHETAKVWLLSTHGDRQKAVWIPKSMGVLEGSILALPEQFAIDKGLI
ncbi:hypothetical protein FZC33_00235 [Labrys sp. KNU-23]|uniref:hypothetical protein n=1 Tax=Labrys sp. KNU-23 TaxID=2789216 RepID=UPI0011EF03BD|nr:hypothetical protein [Labrys sp. KNU-23]QEN84757.1 hypothetical protein FZC33_00235 [Labrys sp. KNU-23]